MGFEGSKMNGRRGANVFLSVGSCHLIALSMELGRTARCGTHSDLIPRDGAAMTARCCICICISISILLREHPFQQVLDIYTLLHVCHRALQANVKTRARLVMLIRYKDHSYAPTQQQRRLRNLGTNRNLIPAIHPLA
ncbi:hypothetical protein K402DRAFT_262504 [Aulographum hederae CBS 113979]|uniref:Uncharacterized protein n=1 Tax=Aulographum hederae CBS 113979 TaxID=1176131 RepID=A0A6G1H9J7_9PEZI|nr:hypothetical protein K402DRAFT_262504 [Aulographum hederae CBS 113979]